MSFSIFLKEHYEQAREIAVSDADAEMIKSLADSNCHVDQVIKWMTSYGLFQGIGGETRQDIANAFLDFAKSHERLPAPLKLDKAKGIFETLLRELYKANQRSWISATSKLLWCLYPNDIAIYDSFVHRSLTVLQSLEPALSSLKPLTNAPRIDSEAKIGAAGDYYGNYLAMIKRLQDENLAFLNEQSQSRDKQPPDIRIIDKILWMIGDPNKAHATKKH
ncbi:MAG: hypothetical protein PHD19_02090 [Dechloromonas sp.]|uniref:hypothetical protein n=1 Tax=Azonexus sp. TaxID=1872668 RepID=UPI0035B03190|nr:hypothetical protein [Dechloromonas sp.]